VFNVIHVIPTVTCTPMVKRSTGRATCTDRTRRSRTARARETSTGRARLTNRTPQCQRPVVSSKHPHATGRVWSIVTGHATASDRLRVLRSFSGLDRTRWSRDRPDAPVRNPSYPSRSTAAGTDRTRSVIPRPSTVQRPVTPVTSVRLRFYPR
jgi:hypothetical protein